MKFASFRFFRFFLCVMLLVAVVTTSGCMRRQQPPAEVIYRPKNEIQQPIRSAPVTAVPGAVQQSSAPARPRLGVPGEQVVIGMILPLSGAQAEIGGQMRDAALMGLYDALETAPKLDAAAAPKLLIRDSGASPAQSAQAAQELIAEGASIILGPLVAADVAAAGKITAENGLALISFSNTLDVARPNVYVFGFLPYQQVNRVAQYAAQQQIEHYSALAPQDDYGRMVVRDFSQAMQGQGKVVQPVDFYPAGSTPSAADLKRLTNNAQKIGQQRKALFLPASDASLETIAAHFMSDAKANGGFLKLLGTGLWDQPQTLGIPALQGAWFATTSPDLSLKYNERFNDQYGYLPTRVASLAYDAVMLAAGQAIERGSAGLSPAALLQKGSFNLPANGKVRLNANGRVDRALAVVQVGQGFSILSPAMLP